MRARDWRAINSAGATVQVEDECHFGVTEICSSLRSIGHRLQQTQTAFKATHNTKQRPIRASGKVGSTTPLTAGGVWAAANSPPSCTAACTSAHRDAGVEAQRYDSRCSHSSGCCAHVAWEIVGVRCIHSKVGPDNVTRKHTRTHTHAHTCSPHARTHTHALAHLSRSKQAG